MESSRKARITLTDNDYKGTPFSAVGITAENERDLMRIADINVSDLRLDEHPNLILYPSGLKKAKDRIADGQICSIRNKIIRTGNLMGFIGVGNTQLSIKSRFTSKHDEDYFMHYMLCRVLSLNVLSLRHNYNDQSAFDFLLYLLPSYLLAAYRQGLYKTYLRKQYNDARVRGSMDVARNIRQNIPFVGKVAFNTRELSYDNSVTQLVRHTIEYVETNKYGAGILASTEVLRNAVRAFKDATPTYNRHERVSVIKQNIRPVAHPYYTAYTALQRLCIQILKHEGLKYEGDKDDVYGILFDGAWLWEEYLNTLMRELKFVHAENKEEKNGIIMYGKHYVYPDFYKKNERIVIDAKYKKKQDADDLLQIVAYMHIMSARIGGFAYPSVGETERVFIGNLNGYGGSLFDYSLHIPQTANDMLDFCKQMEETENKFLRCVSE